MPADDLLPYIFGNTRLPLAVQFAQWLRASPRFYTFAETYRDKIRKKVRGAADAEGYRDLEAELATAVFLVEERRFVVEYEKHGVGKQREPDFSVTFRTHVLFNVEVTRLRVAPTGTAPELSKLTNTLCAKLGQLPPSVINVLALVTDAPVYSADDLAGVLGLLHTRATQTDDDFFLRRGLAGARDFLKLSSRLSAIRLSATGAAPILWLPSTPRHPLPPDLTTILRK
jgi:hypothetical protein